MKQQKIAHVCYVCKKPIRGPVRDKKSGMLSGGPLCIGRDKKGRLLYRHRSKCVPGSKQYMRNRVLRRGWNIFMGR